ncbi:hypothetical protein VNO80_06206 [Phaseolus coccineus]|uniref:SPOROCYTELESS-like EAR-containing protein n=1 Tax=Phaseolus coccineus TaxID=3886 RepID=A0AAN9NNE2_PHACN
MQINNSLKSGGNGDDGSRKQKGPRIRKRGPGVAELERMMRQEERVKGNSELMAGNQFSSTFQNSMISPSNFQLLPSINNPHGFNGSEQNYCNVKCGTSTLFHHSSYNSDILMHTHTNFPPSSTHLFSGNGNVHPSQVPQDKINSYQHSESGGQRPIPFYNFLGVEDSEEVTDPETLEAGKGKEDIDLNLKL